MTGVDIVILFVISINVLSSTIGSVISPSEKHGYPCDNQTLHSPGMASCTYDRDCVENAYCWHSETCHCMDGYLINKNGTKIECLKIAGDIGDECIADIQCRVTLTAQAECRNNKCTCVDGAHYEPEPKRCYENSGIGQICQTSYNCYIQNSSSFCVDGYCSCPLQHHSNPDGTKCIKNALLGEECSIDEECIDPNSRCFGMCACKVDYVLSNDGKECLRAANSMGDPCIEDSQCTAFLKNVKCSEDNRCICLFDLKKHGSQCRRKLNPQMLGKECTHRGQCVQPTSLDQTGFYKTDVINVDCTNGICACARGYILTEMIDDCVRFSENSTSRIRSITLPLWIFLLHILRAKYFLQ